MAGITRRAFLGSTTLALVVSSGAMLGCSSKPGALANSSSESSDVESTATESNSQFDASSSTQVSLNESWLEVKDLKTEKIKGDEFSEGYYGLLMSGTVVNNGEDAAIIDLEAQCTEIIEDKYGDEEREPYADLNWSYIETRKGGSPNGLYDLRAGESREFAFVLGESEDYKFEDIELTASCSVSSQSLDDYDEHYDVGHDFKVENRGAGEGGSMRFSLTNNTGRYIERAGLFCVFKVVDGGVTSWKIGEGYASYMKPGASDTVEINVYRNHFEFQEVLYVSYYIDTDKS